MAGKIPDEGFSKGGRATVSIITGAVACFVAGGAAVLLILHLVGEAKALPLPVPVPAGVATTDDVKQLAKRIRRLELRMTHDMAIVKTKLGIADTQQAMDSEE